MVNTGLLQKIGIKMNTNKTWKLLSLMVPPIFNKIWVKVFKRKMPKLPEDFDELVLSSHALYKLIKDFEFTTVLDIGSGAGAHAKVLHRHNKKVTALDFGTSIYANIKGSNYKNIEHLELDFYEFSIDRKFDCIWASHVLEHQKNPGEFIRKCMELVKTNGIIAITIPPMEQNVLGGHLTNWNAGLLLYNLIINGVDCSDCSILSYGYNISIIVKNKKRGTVELTYDNGDIKKLMQYFPSCINSEPFDGRIEEWNW